VLTGSGKEGRWRTVSLASLLLHAILAVTMMEAMSVSSPNNRYEVEGASSESKDGVMVRPGPAQSFRISEHEFRQLPRSRATSGPKTACR
jgi:hypothetical protein